MRALGLAGARQAGRMALGRQALGMNPGARLGWQALG
jgi:hypothetical protein